MTDHEACARKSVFTQAYDQYLNGPLADQNANSGFPPPKPASWMRCTCCTGSDWMIPSLSSNSLVTVNQRFVELFPKQICQDPDFSCDAAS